MQGRRLCPALEGLGPGQSPQNHPQVSREPWAPPSSPAPRADGRACISPLTLPPGGAHSPGRLGMLLLKTRELIVEGNGRGGREGGLKTHSPQPAGLGSGTGQESPKEISWDSRNVARPPAARGLWDGNKPVLGFRKATHDSVGQTGPCTQVRGQGDAWGRGHSPNCIPWPKAMPPWKK